MPWKKLANFKESRQYLVTILVGVFLFFIIQSGLFNPIINIFQIISVPLQSSFEHTTKGVSNFVQTIGEIGGLRSINSHLRAENAVLKSENISLKLLEKENQSLRAQLKTPQTNFNIIAAAHPVGNGAVGTKNVLLIDKGTNDKIKTKDLVLFGNIFLGEVISVTPRLSSVQLLSDPATKIPAITVSKAEGIIQGDFGSAIKLTDVVQEERLNIGEQIFTSGRNGWPKGLLLGQISKVNKIDKDFFQQAEVKSAIDINELDLIYVISLN